MINFRAFLPLKETLVATFKACTLTSRKQVAEQGMNVSVYHKHLKVWWSYCTVFALQK